jgi:hypothetical protein
LSDPVQDLMDARTTLINERRSQARSLANPGMKTNELVQSFFAIQQTLEAINRAIADERKRKAAARRPGF